MVHTLQTIPREPEETSISGFCSGLALLNFCLMSLTFYSLLGPAGILVAAVIFLLRRYLLREDLCEDWAEACCCEQGSYDADAAPPRPEQQTPPAPAADAAATRVEQQTPPAPVVDAATRRRRAAEASAI